MKTEYMKEVIAKADSNRLKDESTGKSKDIIRMTDDWMDELTKYPFISSMTMTIHKYRKTWQSYLLVEGEKQSRQSQEAD